MMPRLIAVVVLAAAGLGAGCAGRTATWDLKPPALGLPPPPDAGRQAELQRLRAEGDAAWARRESPQELEAALERWSAALEVRGDDAKTLVRMSRAHHFRGEVHLADGAPAARRAAFDQGLAFAERALLAASPALARRLRNGATMLRAVEVVGPEGAAALYWYAANLLDWSGARGLIAEVAWHDEIETVLRRIVAIEPGFAHGGAHRLLGRLTARLPTWAGGDLDAARAHFERALEYGPALLATRVDLAERVALPRNDAALFTTELRAVLHAEDDPPELGPENRIARQRARALLQAHPELAEAADAGENP